MLLAALLHGTGQVRLPLRNFGGSQCPDCGFLIFCGVRLLSNEWLLQKHSELNHQPTIMLLSRSSLGAHFEHQLELVNNFCGSLWSGPWLCQRWISRFSISKFGYFCTRPASDQNPASALELFAHCYFKQFASYCVTLLNHEKSVLIDIFRARALGWVSWTGPIDLYTSPAWQRRPNLMSRSSFACPIIITITGCHHHHSELQLLSIMNSIIIIFITTTNNQHQQNQCPNLRLYETVSLVTPIISHSPKEPTPKVFVVKLWIILCCGSFWHGDPGFYLSWSGPLSVN